MGAERGFELDRFQIEAMAAIDAGHSVLVAAPTGSGKTVVAEHAVSEALARGAKVFYTAPIKALCNQKYHDLVASHGAASVGLLTGDNAIGGDRAVVVMTTEVLRNMIYAESPALEGLRWVVLDEVHYLQDTYRGPVWEEVIVHLPVSVGLVCLSATVTNADELVEWLRTVRGPTVGVVETHRPVELTNSYLVEDRDTDQLHLLPTLVGGRPNPEAGRFDVVGHGPRRGRPRRRWATPLRPEVVDLLAGRDLLPAIVFVFSRAGCDDAVRACVQAGVRLTTPDQRAAIRAVAERHVEPLSDDDLGVLGYDEWVSSLEAGVGAHHAGMAPPFKEAVEACFTAGLLAVVFATETLALGVNMPARTVVIEKLTKFTGEGHEFLTPAQYTQLTGRAGRRGIDNHGTAVVLWSPFVSFGEVAGLASSRSFPLTSAFRPTYNMAGNLVRRYEPEQAHHLLNLSFAQYQADGAVVRLETRLARREADVAALKEQARCERGDIDEYLRLVESEAVDSKVAAADRRQAVRDGLTRLTPGDVVAVAGTVAGGLAAVLSVSHRRGGAVRVRVVTATRKVLVIGEDDVNEPLVTVGRVELPTPFAPRSVAFQREVAGSLHRMTTRRVGRRGAARARSGSPTRAATDGGAGPGPHTPDRGEHPVAGCPDRPAHVKAALRARRAEREVAELTVRIRRHGDSLARRFDKVLGVLGQWGYLDDWELTERGQRLVRVYHEADLLIAESLHEGLFDELDVPATAALASSFTYEHRAPGPPPEPWFPSVELRQRWRRLEQLHAELSATEVAAGLPATRRPDPGFFAIAHGWASGGQFGDVLDDEEVAPGDFVRNTKQLVDLLRQIGDAAPDPSTASTARAAAEAVFRGVVAASAVIEAAP